MTEFLATWVHGGSGLTLPDFIAFAILAVGMTLLGLWSSRGVTTAEDFFSAGRSAPGFLAALALIAAEISVLTVIGLTANAFREDWSYVQFFIGAAAARIIAAYLFLPLFMRSKGATPYGYLGDRFGPLTRRTAAGVFIVTRLSVSAVRLMTASIAAGALLGWDPHLALALFTIVALVGLLRGGARAAIWTGAFQMMVIFGVGLLCIVFILRRIDGGITAAWGVIATADKFGIFHGGLSTNATAWLMGFCGAAASFTTDHELTQKAMSVSSVRRGQGVLLAAVIGALAAMLMFLTIGSLLFVFYKQNPGMALPDHLDRIYPHFAMTMMPRILRGLVLAAIFLASADAPLASLSTALVADVVQPVRNFGARQQLLWARSTAGVVALLLTALAAYFDAHFEALSFIVKAAGVAAGPMLGIFALGLSKRRVGDRAATLMLLSVCLLNFLLLVLAERSGAPFNWSWLIPFGACATYALGWLLVSIPRASAHGPG